MAELNLIRRAHNYIMGKTSRFDDNIITIMIGNCMVEIYPAKQVEYDTELDKLIVK